MEPFAAAQAAADALAERTQVDRHDVAVVLGSGWGAAVDALGDEIADLAAGDLPGFAEPSVPGHGGRLRSLRAGRQRVLLLQGRVHLYEGHPAHAVVHGVRAAILAGCGTVILTNAAGSLRRETPPGTGVLIADHLNLTGTSATAGALPPPPHDQRFVDLTDLYSPRLRALAQEVAPGLAEGVYAGMLGPVFETPAEIRMLQALGADLVGMSTVLEAQAARHLGAEVLGLSLVTNLAAGLQERVDHEEVLAEGARAAAGLGAVLRGVIDRLGAPAGP